MVIVCKTVQCYGVIVTFTQHHTTVERVISMVDPFVDDVS